MLDQASRLADGLIAWEYHTGGIPPPWVQKSRQSFQEAYNCLQDERCLP